MRFLKIVAIIGIVISSISCQDQQYDIVGKWAGVDAVASGKDVMTLSPTIINVGLEIAKKEELLFNADSTYESVQYPLSGQKFVRKGSYSIAGNKLFMRQRECCIIKEDGGKTTDYEALIHKATIEKASKDKLILKTDETGINISITVEYNKRK